MLLSRVHNEENDDLVIRVPTDPGKTGKIVDLCQSRGKMREKFVRI